MDVINTCPVCSSDGIAKTPAFIMPFLSYRIFGWEPLVINAEHGLRTVSAGTSYQLCATSICGNCHLVFCDVRFDDAEMARLYYDYRGSQYTAQRVLFEPDYKATDDYLRSPVHYLDETTSYLDQHITEVRNVLDWGGGDGTNTPLKETGRDIYIYDISFGSDSEIKQLKSSDVTAKMSLEFDLIMSIHVFEHLSYPLSEVKKMRNMLRTDGYIYIEVPYEDLVRVGFSKNVVGKNKVHWHEHINFFGHSSLEKLLVSGGFEVIDISYCDVSDDYRDFSIIRALGKKK